MDANISKTLSSLEPKIRLFSNLYIIRVCFTERKNYPLIILLNPDDKEELKQSSKVGFAKLN